MHISIDLICTILFCTPISYNNREHDGSEEEEKNDRWNMLSAKKNKQEKYDNLITSRQLRLA
jgi:hypothetical protein